MMADISNPEITLPVTEDYSPSEAEREAEIKRLRDLPLEAIATESLIKDHLLRTDHLTGLMNTRGLEEELSKMDEELSPSPEKEMRSPEKTGMISIAVGDLVGLGLVNDTWGRNEGNNYLKNVAKALKTVVKRENDLLAAVRLKEGTAARLGEQSDEVVLVLPGASPEDALRIVSSINADLEEMQQLAASKFPGIIYRLSVSIAKLRPGERLINTFERAQGSLHEAKEKNREGKDKKSTPLDVGVVLAD